MVQGDTDAESPPPADYDPQRSGDDVNVSLSLEEARSLLDLLSQHPLPALNAVVQDLNDKVARNSQRASTLTLLQAAAETRGYRLGYIETPKGWFYLSKHHGQLRYSLSERCDWPTDAEAGDPAWVEATFQRLIHTLHPSGRR